jgi:putative transposase
MLWLAAVRDAFSKRVVGWRVLGPCDTYLVLGALERPYDLGRWWRETRLCDLGPTCR